jgi:hypothetical protein
MNSCDRAQPQKIVCFAFMAQESGHE